MGRTWPGGVFSDQVKKVHVKIAQVGAFFNPGQGDVAVPEIGTCVDDGFSPYAFSTSFSQTPMSLLTSQSV
jgi:hypothetical protein